MDGRGKFEKVLVEKVTSLIGISTVVVERPDDDEEAVYQNGILAEVS